jgi:CBS domain-containing protein
MNISEIMSTRLVTCDPNDTLHQVAQKMQQHDVGACPVVEGDKLVGIVTDRDLTIRAIARGMDPNLVSVDQVMTTNVVTGSPDMSIEEACRLMSDAQVRRLPIVEQDKLVGIVSLADLAMDVEEEEEMEELLVDTLVKVSQPQS